MDDRQRQRTNEAAQQFAEALTESYKAVSDRSVSAQQLNAKLTQDFFNAVIDNFRTHTESTRTTSQELLERARRGKEATQALTRGSVGAYLDFLDSMFAFYQGSVAAAERSTEQAVDTQTGSETMKAEGGAGREEGAAEGHREYFGRLIEETNRRFAGKA
jgi:hypothetical protein